MTAAAARQQMASPVEFNRRHELRSVTLTIPLLGERNSYLVVRIPNEMAQEAVRLAREQPEAERPAFLREWLMRNQQVVLETYVRGGRSARRFNYEVVPGAAMRVTDATPRRVAEPNPPPRQVVEESPHRLIETRHYYDHGEDTPPPGWRAIRRGETLPAEVRARSNVLRPPRGDGQVPLGDGRTEEFSGHRYLYLSCTHGPDRGNPRRHEGISVYVPDENYRAPAPRVIQPEVRGSREVVPSPPIERREIPVPQPQRRELPPFPTQIKGGNGSQQRPYEVYMSRAEVQQDPRHDSPAENIITVPLELSIEGLGNVRFLVAFRGRQLTRSVRGQTQGELWQILRQTVDRVAAERSVRLDNTAIRTAQSSYLRSFPQIMARVEAADADLGRYLSSN